MLLTYFFALIIKHNKYTVKDTASHEDQLISIFAGFTLIQQMYVIKNPNPNHSIGKFRIWERR